MIIVFVPLLMQVELEPFLVCIRISPSSYGSYLLMSHLLHGLHVVKRYLPFPSSKGFLIINRMRRDFEVVNGTEDLGEIGPYGSFIEVEYANSYLDSVYITVVKKVTNRS
jgi:hypothetical protein